MAVAHTVGKLVEYGFGDAFVIGIVFQITHFMHAEGGSSAQSHHAGGIAEGQSAVVEHVGQQGGLVYFRLVIVAVQRAELVQGGLEPFRREHIRHVQRDGHRLTRVRSFILYFQLSWVSLYLPKAMYHLHRMDCSLAQYGSSHSTVKVRFSSVR